MIRRPLFSFKDTKLEVNLKQKKFIFNFFNLLTVTEKKYIITGSRKRAKPLTDENTATPLTPITINVTVPSFFFSF